MNGTLLPPERHLNCLPCNGGPVTIEAAQFSQLFWCPKCGEHWKWDSRDLVGRYVHIPPELLPQPTRREGHTPMFWCKVCASVRIVYFTNAGDSVGAGAICCVICNFVIVKAVPAPGGGGTALAVSGMAGAPPAVEVSDMERATRKDLFIRVKALGDMMRTQLSVNTNASGYRIECDHGGRDLSPRGTLRQTLDWVDAGIAVVTNMGRG